MPDLTTSPQAAAVPVSDAEFASRMARLGGFESAPRLAVGVSGGGDSLALTLLLHRWATEQGGALLALTVDHALRPESAAEAAGVAQTMARIGVPHRVLRWEGEKPHAGLQAAAREARHRLLIAACVEAGVPHLALAHNQEDQAETLLLRLSRGSGVDGLAGMAPSRPAGPIRLIRPCLDLPHERLLATCRAAGMNWVEDPSNQNPRFARARLRVVGALLAEEGLTAERLAETARRAARARAALERATADLLAVAASLRPEGWIRLDPAPVMDAPEEIALRALTRCLTVVGGGLRPIRDAAVERLYGELRDGLEGGRTLAGCRTLRRRGAVLIVREAEAVTDRRPVAPGESVWWDRRFAVTPSAARRVPVEVARLGVSGWSRVVAEKPELRRLDLHATVRETLPGLWSDGRLLAVPTLGFAGDDQPMTDLVRFSPALPLAGPAFPVVLASGGII